MKKNLVMGSASGYDWTMLEPFVTSFVRNCPSAELVLFVNDLSDFTRDRLISCGGVKLEPFKVIRLPVNDRWNNFLDYLEAHGDEYEQVFITDTRDVIFQSDVFEAFKGNVNWLGYSTEQLPIGQERKHNCRWIEMCFGKEQLDKIADKMIICAGSAAIGSTREIKIFLEKMLATNPRKDVIGSDQATMNYIIHNKLLPIETLIENDVDTGKILTNGRLSKTLDDKILRGDGGVPAVVHQYDRGRGLIQFVDKIYRDKNFQADERFTDPRSAFEQVRQLAYIGKTEDAARFFMSIHGADFSGNIELLLKIWEILLTRPFMPAVGYLELSIHNALATVKNFSIRQLDVICSRLYYTIKNGHVVNPQFVKFVAQNLLNTAEQSLDERNRSIFTFCTETIKSLPPDKDLSLLQTEASKKFGKKE